MAQKPPSALHALPPHPSAQRPVKWSTHIPLDVTIDLLNDMEERPKPSNGGILLPRSAAQFPPGFRGYFARPYQHQQLASQGQEQLTAGLPGGITHHTTVNVALASSWPGAAQAGREPAAQGTTKQPPHLQAVLAEVQAILPSGQDPVEAASRVLTSTNFDDVALEAWALEQLEKAGNWKAVDAILQALEHTAKALASTSAQGQQQQQQQQQQQLKKQNQPSMLFLECAMLRLKDLGLDFQLLGVQGFGRNDWDGLGKRLCLLLNTHCQKIVNPVQSLERAVCVIDAMQRLGPAFYCRSYCDQAVVAATHSLQCESPMEPHTLSHFLAACAGNGHLLKQSWLQALVPGAIRQLPHMDGPALVHLLWACSKYRINVGSLGIRVTCKADQDEGIKDSVTALSGCEQGRPEAASLLPCAASNTTTPKTTISDLQSAQPLLTPPPRHIDHITTTVNTDTTLLNFVLARLHRDLHFSNLTPLLVAQLLSAVAACDAQPDTDLMDDCLLSLLQQPHTTHTTTSMHTKQATNVHQQSQFLKQPGALGATQLLASLSRLGYQPPEEMSCAILNALEHAMVPNLLYQQEPRMLSGPQHQQQSQQQQGGVGSNLDAQQHQLQHQQHQGRGPLVNAQQQLQQPLPPDELGKAAQQLASLQINASGRWCQLALQALLSAPGGPPVSSACQLVCALPDLMGVTNKALKPWVNWNQPALEQVTLCIGPHLKAASCQDLFDVIAGFAKLRYYPGTRFMHWHQAACWQAVRKFPPETLVMIRAAYTSLGYQAEVRLSKTMDKAQKRLTKQHALQLRRSGQDAELPALLVSKPKIARQPRGHPRQLRFTIGNRVTRGRSGPPSWSQMWRQRGQMVSQGAEQQGKMLGSGRTQQRQPRYPGNEGQGHQRGHAIVSHGLEQQQEQVARFNSVEQQQGKRPSCQQQAFNNEGSKQQQLCLPDLAMGTRARGTGGQGARASQGVRGRRGLHSADGAQGSRDGVNELEGLLGGLDV